MNQTLAYVLGVLILVVGIGASVALHELGHMIPAKRFGVKVPEYFIGFGPRLWSTRRGETEYGVKAIWLGGYVKLVGMIPPARPGRPDKPGSQVADIRAESMAEIEPGQEHRAFYALSVPRKLAVMAGGILTNLVLGVVLLSVSLGVIGAPTRISTLATVAPCVPANVDSGSPTCADTSTASPAAAAGLQAGDAVVSWGGHPVQTWTEVQDAIAASGAAPTQVVLERDGARRTVTVTPVMVQRVVRDAAGAPVTGSDGQPLTQERPYVGIGPATGTVRLGPGQVASQVAGAVGLTLRAIVTLPVGLYHATAAALGWEERSPEGLISLVGVGRVAGETASSGGPAGAVPISVRASTMVGILGSLNLALFAFNLIPLLPLDGGHIAGACWEGVRRWWARRRGRPDPGYADTARMVPVGQVVVVLLLVMGGILIWADVVAPI